MPLFELFDPIKREVSRRGGRFESSAFETLIIPLEESLELAAESANFLLRKPRTVVSCIVNDMSFNAKAAIVARHKYLVTINKGMVIKLLMVFSRLVNQSNFLPLIVDRPLPEAMSKELKDQIAYRKYKTSEFFKVLSLTNDRVPANRPPLVQIPSDPVRMQLILSLVEFAIEFVSFHETKHITEGHLDYLVATKKTGDVDESYQTTGGSGSLWTPYLEADADAHAVHTVLAVLMGLLSEYDFTSTMRPLAGGLPFRDARMVYETWLHSVAAFLLVLSSLSPLPDRSGIKTHPFGLYRFITISSYLERIWPTLGFQSAPPLRSAELYIKLSVQLTKAGLGLEGVHSALTEFIHNGELDRFKARISEIAVTESKKLHVVKNEIIEFPERLPEEASARIPAMEEIVAKLAQRPPSR